MLFLVFTMGDDRYAFEAAQVIEILPLVNWKSVPGALPGVAGIIDYRGNPIPLLDLSELALGKPSQRWMSTRIVVVNYGPDSDKPLLLGFLAERATATIRRNEEAFLSSGLASNDAPYLGPIAVTPEGLVQRINLEHVLPESIRGQLFVAPSAAEE